MPVIAVGKPNGVVGKSPLASDDAGWLAHRPHAVVLGHLRDTQNDVQPAARGLMLRNTTPSRGDPEREQWPALLVGADR